MPVCTTQFSAVVQLESECKKRATPADWQIGQGVIIPFAINDKDAKKKFGTFQKVLPYLRKVKLKEI